MLTVAGYFGKELVITYWRRSLRSRDSCARARVCVCGSLSHSSVDLGTSSAATSRSLSRGISQGSDSELSSAANQLILDYMKKVVVTVSLEITFNKATNIVIISLHCPCTNLPDASRSFHVAAPMIWHSLHSVIHSSQAIDLLRECLKTHVF